LPPSKLLDDLPSRVAAAPISWGVCEVPGWGLQLPVGRVLREMGELGFTHTELGAADWLPSQARPLRATLAEHHLRLLGGFVPLVVHDETQAGPMLERASQTAALLAALDASYFNTAPITSVDWRPRYPLTGAQWEHAVAMFDQIDGLCADHGLTQVVHQHAGCVIETRSEVERLLASSLVKVVLDTGHLAVGGYAPLDFARDHADRVGLVHLKDTRLAVADRLNAGELSLMGAVQHGLFPPLGRGDLPLIEVVAELERSGYDGWYVIEQDCALTGSEPPPGEGPKIEVAASLDHLRHRLVGVA
jgi:inosose dehydratase